MAAASTPTPATDAKPTTTIPTHPNHPPVSVAASAMRLLHLTFTRIPLLLTTALLHPLRLSSHTNRKWDLRTALIVRFLRDIMARPGSSVTRMQRFTLRDRGVKGRMWVARATLAGVEGAAEAVVAAVKGMGGGEAEWQVEARDVQVEWTGYRAGVAESEKEPQGWSEERKYEALMSEVKGQATVLYFHGGAYYLMDPATHRDATARLAHDTHGRVCSVRYRLAPQHPFPAALLDALVAYLNLLYPAPDALHAAVDPSHVVFAGDSAGGGLSFALALLLLHLRREASTATITLPSGQRLPAAQIPLPGGVTGISPWVDLTRSLPSQRRNYANDYLPPSFASAGRDARMPPPCAVWPLPPPRADLYCDAAALAHPLVSPAAAPPAAWAGCPPVWLCAGEEMIADEDAVLARRVRAAGAKVRLESYEAMPHVFAFMLKWLHVADVCMDGWAGFVRAAVEGREVKTGAVWVDVQGEETQVEWGKVCEVGEEEVDALMLREKERRSREWSLAVGRKEKAG